MELPEIITSVPEADLPFPSSVVKTSVQTRSYRPGNSYFIPAGAVHSAKLPAGTKVIEFFEEPDRYRLKV